MRTSAMTRCGRPLNRSARASATPGARLTTSSTWMRRRPGEGVADERGVEGQDGADPRARRPGDRKSVVEGKSVSVRVDLGGRRIIRKKKQKKENNIERNSI